MVDFAEKEYRRLDNGAALEFVHPFAVEFKRLAYEAVKRRTDRMASHALHEVRIGPSRHFSLLRSIRSRLKGHYGQ